MAPTIYLVRHGQAENNVGIMSESNSIRDALLTPHGKAQCLNLRENFPYYHNEISIVMSSPLRRAIQTASIAFGPTIRRPDVASLLLVPLGQEISDKQCDIGHDREELQRQVPALLSEEAGQDVGFDFSKKIDFSLVEDGWNSKSGVYATDHVALTKRAALLRSWLYQRPEPAILFVTHGAFLHYLTEDWSGDDPERGTAYLNCEVRIFDFTPQSTLDDAHFSETEQSIKAREAEAGVGAGAGVGVGLKVENDPAVLAEHDAVPGGKPI